MPHIENISDVVKAWNESSDPAYGRDMADFLESNARLIAAAPEMLAMLKECFEVIDNYTDKYLPDDLSLAALLAPLETLINQIESK